ncbi:U11/U12 small nuclear ribonucleoprotein 25 kDa protein-like [Phymastichus coffea]|uniref:U11/U12 small nuclear ribonucleoprotein 25 kDa protein-like n=1 Tax=Phymastichus coffea TaxID=108790 RepID=UPI00273BFBB8|nr:U11/U12 small nuclear ribonucleoprotein 25 kDa protein-like [Phymastichus coffea]
MESIEKEPQRNTREEANSVLLENRQSDKLSHEALIKLTKEAIAGIIETDPLLKDLRKDSTSEEIKAATAVAQGQAIQLKLDRGPLKSLIIVVPRKNTTILDLKKAIQRHTNVALRREGINKKISWKHVWKKYHLCFDYLRLTDDSEPIDNYGIVNDSELRYAKKRREKK